MFLEGKMSDYVYDFNLERLPESPNGLRIWKDRFYRAMYRILFAGALFSRAYNEPFFETADKAPQGFLCDYLVSHDANRNDDEEIDLELRERDIRYLEKFVAYNFFGNKEGEKTLFREFPDWLIKDSKTRVDEESHRGAGEIYTEYDIIQLVAIWETMLLVAAYEHLSVYLRNAYGLGRFGSDDQIPVDPMVEIRKVDVVMFDIFQAEEISMPARVDDAARTALIPNPICRNNSSLPKFVDIPCISSLLFTSSGRLNHHRNGWSLPPPPLHVFVFILRHHFKLQFDANGRAHFADHEFQRNSKIFSNRDCINSDWSLPSHGFEVLNHYQATELQCRRIS
jgi:hypothetical protein